MKSLRQNPLRNSIHMLRAETSANLQSTRGFLSHFAPSHQYTKYKIVRPFMNVTSEWEDALIAEPDSDRLLKFNKEVPVFLRFLKLICDQEKRSHDFVEFAKRCEAGLVVHEGAYITKNELLNIMDKNGYSHSELTAYTLAFPDDYKFHYPELAVAFDLKEEDTYKFCMRTRMNNQEILSMKYDKTPGFLVTFIATYVSLAGALSNPMGLAHYAFVGKIIPYYLSIGLLWRSMGRGVLAENRQALQEIDRSHERLRLEGQETILHKTARFAEDTNSVAYLDDFKKNLLDKMNGYKLSMVREQQKTIHEKMLKQLNSIRSAERAASSGIQEILGKEIVASFKSYYNNNNEKMNKDSLKSAIDSIKGEGKSEDPVKSFILKSLKEFESVDLNKVKGNEGGSIVERIAFLHQKKEKDFLNQYAVKRSEAEKVKAMAQKCNGDVSKLSTEEVNKLNSLHKEIYERVGFGFFDENKLQTADEKSNGDLSGAQKAWIETINKHLIKTKEELRKERLEKFMRQF